MYIYVYIYICMCIYLTYSIAIIEMKRRFRLFWETYHGILRLFGWWCGTVFWTSLSGDTAQGRLETKFILGNRWSLENPDETQDHNFSDLQFTDIRHMCVCELPTARGSLPFNCSIRCMHKTSTFILTFIFWIHPNVNSNFIVALVSWSQPLITKPQEAFHHAIAAQLLAEHSQQPMQLLEATWFEVTGKIGIENWVIQLHLDQLRSKTFVSLFFGESFFVSISKLFFWAVFFIPQKSSPKKSSLVVFFSNGIFADHS